MTAQIEVKLGRMSDANVYSRASRYVTALADLVLLVSTEEARVVALLYNNECDTWLVSHLQFHTSLTDGLQFHGQYL